MVIALDFANPAAAAVRTRREGTRLDGVDFCWHDATLRAAMENFAVTCDRP